ncbi:MAG TPA: nitrate/nitrite transporter NrtS [Niastella sp.]
MTNKNIKRALIVAIVVGSLLNTINSYDVFWNGNFTTRNVLRIVLTYITPFCVSLYSSVKATKSA